MSNNLEASVIDAIARHKLIEPTQIKRESLLADLGISSLDAITIVYDIEEEFGVEVPNEALETLQTVGDIVDGMQILLDARG